MDYYLVFPDQDAANKVLYGVENEPKYANIDTIGVIYKPTGETAQQNEIDVPVMAALPGWHVNVRVIDEDDMVL